MESKLEDGQCGFRLVRRTTNQIFTSLSNLGKMAKDLCACIVNLEKAYDRVPRDKLWEVLQEYGVDSQLLVQ